MASIPTLGKIALLLVVLILPGAGAAAGVTFAGDVTGTATTKVDQAITVNSATTAGNVNNALGTVSDDGTKFRHAVNINQGDEYELLLDMSNRGDQALNGRLVLKVPSPLTYTVTGVNGIEVARLDMSEWMITVQSWTGPTETVTESVGAGLERGDTYTTKKPVADRNNDGVVDRNDLTYINVDSPETFTTDQNPDGTVTITFTTSDSLSPTESGDKIRYTTGGTDLIITIAAPDDIEPGFYTITGEIRPTEV